MPIIAAIIGAVAVIGTTIIGTSENSKDVDEVNRIGQMNANRAREDKLKRDKWNEDYDRWGMRQKEKEFAWGKKESKKDRAERAEVRGYERRERTMANTLGMVNQNATLRDIFLKTSRRQ